MTNFILIFSSTFSSFSAKCDKYYVKWFKTVSNDKILTYFLKFNPQSCTLISKSASLGSSNVNISRHDPRLETTSHRVGNILCNYVLCADEVCATSVNIPQMNQNELFLIFSVNTLNWLISTFSKK